MVKKIIPAIVILLFAMAQPSWANSVIDYTQSSGVSTMGIFRGILGMAVVIGLAYLASINKKAINWKVVNWRLGHAIGFSCLRTLYPICSKCI